MCENCKGIILRKRFHSSHDYMECIAYIKTLLATGKYELIDATCDIHHIKNANGCWVNDLISHTLRCKLCGSDFICIADTYHGSGSFVAKELYKLVLHK